ncbi:MAG: alpha/beta fold hydrolase, partial [Nitratireductor sp.]
MPIAELPSSNIYYEIHELSEGLQTGVEQTIILVHGFVSNARVNWVNTGWVKKLVDAGYKTIVMDNRGHGKSQKFYEEDDYSLEVMANDTLELLNHLDVTKCNIMGYSMGARISSKLVMQDPNRFDKLIIAGNAYNMIAGAGDWTPVRDAMLVPSLQDVTTRHARGFRSFADQTNGDLKALAACVMGARELFSEAQFNQIQNEVLVAIGTDDDIAGEKEKFVALMPNATYLPIPNRDHMRAVG